MLPLSWSYRSPRHSSTYNTPPKAKNITTTRMTMLDIKHVDPLPLCNHTNTVINRCWRTLSSPVNNSNILSMFPRQLIGRVSYLIPTGTPTFSNFRRHRVYAPLAVSEVWKCDRRLSYVENSCCGKMALWQSVRNEYARLHPAIHSNSWVCAIDKMRCAIWLWLGLGLGFVTGLDQC